MKNMGCIFNKIFISIMCRHSPMTATRDEYEQGFKNPTHKHVIPQITQNGEIG